MMDDEHDRPVRDLTESELAARAEQIKKIHRKYEFHPARNQSRPIKRRDRWINWDQLSVGDDFWDTLDELDEKRQGEIREQRQMEELQRQHDRRLDKMKIDREKFMAEEPYAESCRQPELHETVAVPAPEPAARHVGRNPAATMRANMDRRIIEENKFEIEAMIERGVALTKIADEFQITYAVLLREAKKRGWVA